jgi:hypothetical protein
MNDVLISTLIYVIKWNVMGSPRETENKKITRDGTIFSLTGKKHEEQPKN